MSDRMTAPTRPGAHTQNLLLPRIQRLEALKTRERCNQLSILYKPMCACFLLFYLVNFDNTG